MKPPKKNKLISFFNQNKATLLVILFISIITNILLYHELSKVRVIVNNTQNQEPLNFNDEVSIPDYFPEELLNYLDNVPQYDIPEEKVLLPNGQTLTEFNPVRHSEVE